MPPEIDLCPVELPGRAARLDEPPFISMSALMEELGHALQPLMAVQQRRAEYEADLAGQRWFA